MLSEISQAAYLALLLIFVPVPYSTDRKLTTTPWVTCSILAINTIVFLLFVLPHLGGANENDIFDAFGLVPRTPTLLHLFTYMFLHVSLAHLLWNSAFLWLFGPAGEDALGHFPYLLLYISGGVVAGLLHTAIVLLFAQTSAIAFAPMVGASGAISAVIGLYALRFYRSKVNLVWGCAYFLQLRTSRFQVPAIAGLGLWLLQNLCGAVSALLQPDRNGIAYWAHIGGFIFGMAVAELFGMLGEGMREYLFSDAVNAGSRGEKGVREAVRSFHLLLMRKPDDSEVREALALLAQQTLPSDRLMAQTVIGDAYSMLLEQALASGDAVRAREWLAAFREIDAEQLVDSSVLIAIADRAMKSGDQQLAEQLYLKVVERFPGTRDGKQALLDAAMLRLERHESPLSAVLLLSRFLSPKSDTPYSSDVDRRGLWRRLFPASTRSGRT